MKNCNSTYQNYYTIWKLFNSFLVRLDYLPMSWEERTALFCVHLTQRGTKSTTIRSYVSAIKSMLIDDKYKWNNDEVLLNSLIRSCKNMNDIMTTKLPIQCKLLELILFEVERKFEADNQHFLNILYKTIIIISYCGLFRIGEVTKSPTANHTMKAKNVHVATNKDKILIVLYTSKTHGVESLPQRIKISGVTKKGNLNKKFFCPFALIKQYIAMRGGYENDSEYFFVFHDGSEVCHDHVKLVLNAAIKNLGLNYHQYLFHGMRSGRACDMFKVWIFG